MMQINPGFIETKFTEEKWMPEYHEYRKKWTEWPKTGKVGPMPLNLDIEITNACNLNCPFCIRPYMKDKVGFMTRKMYSAIMDEIIGEGVSSVPAVKLNWRGEPTLHKDLPMFVRLALIEGVGDIAINTNGMFSSYLGFELVDAGLHRMIFSIESANPEVYKKYRVGGDLHKVINNISCIMAYRKARGLLYPYIRVQKVDLPELRDETERYIKYFGSLGVDSVAIESYKEKDESKVEWEPLQCSQPFQRIGITWEGNFFACCQGHLFPYIGKFPEMSIKEAWNSDFMKDLREKHHANRQKEIEACRHCETTRPSDEKNEYRIKCPKCGQPLARCECPINIVW